MSAPLLRQLQTLLDTTAPDPTVVFVPRMQVGKALETALARTQPTAGLTCTTVRNYAALLARSMQRETDMRPLEDPAQWATASCYMLSEEQRKELTQGAPVPRVGRMLAQMFATLRMHGISPDLYQSHIEENSSQQAKAEAYRIYTTLLHENHRADAATTLQQAIRIVSAGQVSSCAYTAVGLLDVTDLPLQAERFVNALVDASAHPRYRLGATAPHPADASPASAAHSDCYATAQPVQAFVPGPTGRAVHDDVRPDDAEHLRFARTVGADEEVRTVLRDMQVRDYAHDTVEIAYTTPEPYLGLIEQQLQRHGITATLSSGQRLRDTPSGRALRTYLDWLTGAQDMAGLVHLLRAGHLTLHRARPDDAFQHDQFVATWLAEQTCPDGAASILRAVKRRAEDRTDDKADRYHATSEALRALLHDAPHPDAEHRVAPADLADHLYRFADTFGPKPSKDWGEAQAIESELARKPHERLLAHLKRIRADEHEATEQPLSLAADAVRAVMDHEFGGARAPRPGRVHVVPLESAGYNGRDHLYVVGMDSEAMAVSLQEDPLFTDTERNRLGPTGERIPRTAQRVAHRRWTHAQALNRHAGDALFVMQHLDPAKSEERFPSTLYQRLHAATHPGKANSNGADATHPNETTHTLRIPEPEDALDALDLLHCDSDGVESTAATEWLKGQYPHIDAGREATRARRSKKVTVYDGLLPDPPYPELDFLAVENERVMSPSRLETFAKTPYLYFVKYVLGVREPDEPVLEERGWLNALTRGTILHEAYEQFVQGLGRIPREGDEAALRQALDDALHAQYEKRGRPPSEHIEAIIEHQLWEDAQILIQAEVERAAPGMAPTHFEWSFGFDGSDVPPAVLPIGDGTLHLRGSADRIDTVNGALEIWDYKTGKSDNFDPQDGLSDDRWSLQWLLYAWAAEALLNKTVSRSGYYFATRREMGRRIEYELNDDYSAKGRRILKTLSAMAKSGVFVPSEQSMERDKWRYNFDTLVADRDEHKNRDKNSLSDDRPHLHKSILNPD